MKRKFESPSSLTLYLTCPQKYAFKYRDKLPDPAGAAAILGTDFHNAAYRTWESRDASGEEHPQIRKMLEAMYAHHEIEKLPRTFSFEPEQKVSHSYGDQELFGVIDMGLTDDSVNDFKTSSKKWTEQKVRENFQHIAYTWLARMTKLSTAKTFRYIVVTTTPNPFVQVITVNVSDEYIESYLEQARATTGLIDLDMFYPIAGRHCYYCPYKNICPAFNPIPNVPKERILLEQD